MSLYPLKNIFLIILLTFFYSCKNETNPVKLDESIDTCFKLNQPLENDITVYSIPSPMQIAATIRILDINFEEEIIDSYIHKKVNYAGKILQATNLGISLVDLGYVSLFDKSQYSLELVPRIDNLLDELDIENQETIFACEKIRNNINNKDSISKYIIEGQNNIDRYFQNSDEKESGIMIICGVFIEGLYISVNSYYSLLESQKLSEAHKNYLNTLMFQQDVFLGNLIELCDIYLPVSNKNIQSEFKAIKQAFNDLKISFKYNTNEHKIKDVKLDNKQLEKILTLVSGLRTRIINGNI